MLTKLSRKVAIKEKRGYACGIFLCSDGGSRDPGSYCTLHTGNLLDYSALPRPQRKLSSSAKFSDELPSAINYLAKNDTPFSMTDRVYTPSTRVPLKPNKEVRCTLKVCLSAMLPDYIEDAVRIARNTLHIKAISELIIAFPFAESMVHLLDSFIKKTVSVFKMR
nr:putative glutamate-cysteine ligase modifier [Haemonchus contortus]